MMVYHDFGGVDLLVRLRDEIGHNRKFCIKFAKPGPIGP